jgi:hypothetical protein
MTKFSYNVSIKADGAHITVTRLADKAKKEFFQAPPISDSPMPVLASIIPG